MTDAPFKNDPADESDSSDPGVPLHELSDGSLTRIVRGGTAILLVRIGDEVHAVADTCSHEDVSLSLGSLCGHRLRCPLHGSEFDVRTGAVLSAPADQPLCTWVVENDGERLYLRGDSDDDPEGDFQGDFQDGLERDLESKPRKAMPPQG